MSNNTTFKDFFQKNMAHIGILVFSILIYSSSLIFEKHSSIKNINSDDSPEFFDTYIPHGFAIVPIEISNHTSLDSLISSRGVVDLYATDFTKTHQPSRKIASHLKIVRAPLNRHQFAIIVPDNDVSLILSHKGPYFVTIHNSNGKEPLSVKKSTTQKKRVFINHISDETSNKD